MRGSGHFTIPHVRMGYKHGVKIQLWEGEYTENSMEPFAGFMNIWETKKNAADEEIAKAKEALLSDTIDQDEKERLLDVIKKATFNRAQSKLFANSLPGRVNIKIERPSTLLTKSANDIVCLLGDGVAYQNVQLDSFKLGGDEWWRAKIL